LNVRHLDDGVLRRLIDEPLAASEADRGHLAGCAACRERGDRIAAEATAAGALLAVSSFEPDAGAALARVRNLAAPAPAPRRAWARWSWTASRSGRPLALTLGVALLAGVSIAAAPAVVPIFQPRQVVAVPVTPPSAGAIAGLPDLSKYGTLTVILKGQTATVLSAAEAKQITGLTPPAAPAAFAGQTVTYEAVGKTVVSFTFSEAMAKQAAAAAGKPAPVFPPGIDGTTLTVTLGPAVGEVFGTIDKNTSLSNLPLVEGVSVAPLVTSSGVSASELESFLIQQPGIAGNADLIAQIKAIGDPMAAGSLVIPVPAGYATSKPETVNGVSGILVADNTGALKGLIWQRNGLVYAVGGHFDEGQLLGFAGGI
jgi:hypothetical protein